MFDFLFKWVYELFYRLAAAIFMVCDAMIKIANKLSGIEDVTIEHKKTTFMEYLFADDKITFAFQVSMVVGFILLFIFALFAIIRTIVKEKVEDTPIDILKKVAKNLLIFLFIPVCMLVLTVSLNIIMGVMYKATLGGSDASLGQFLVSAFTPDSALIYGPESRIRLLENGFDYTSLGAVENYVDVADFHFFLAWIAGGFIMLELASVVIMFVERAISIVILYIASPVVVSSSVLDDGQRFKTWRDLLLSKFIVAYGAIIGLNVFALVMNLVCNSDLRFFEDSFLDQIVKVAIVLGGSVSLKQIMGLVGNLVAPGAGDQAMSAANQARSSTTAPFKMIGSTVGGIGRFAKNTKRYGMLSAIGMGIGLTSEREAMADKSKKNGPKGGAGSGNKNEARPTNTQGTQVGGNDVNSILENNNNDQGRESRTSVAPPANNDENNNNQQTEKPRNNAVESSINNILANNQTTTKGN